MRTCGCGGTQRCPRCAARSQAGDGDAMDMFLRVGLRICTCPPQDLIGSNLSGESVSEVPPASICRGGLPMHRDATRGGRQDRAAPANHANLFHVLPRRHKSP